MNFFKFLNFSLKSTEIPVGLRFQLASVTINFTDNRDYRAVLYSMVGTALASLHIPPMAVFILAGCVLNVDSLCPNISAF